MSQFHPESRSRRPWYSRAHLLLLSACAIALGVSRFYGQPSTPPAAPPAKMDVYLLLGDSNMGGRADIPQDATAVLDRCFLLNEKNQWEPARNPLNRHSSIADQATVQALGPGYEFARTLLERDKSLTLGLIVNAGSDTKIEDWLGKSELYRGARKRTREALQDNELKGVLWQQGTADIAAPDGYLKNLQTLISNLRTDCNQPNLPVVVGPLPQGAAINDQVAKVPSSTHVTAVVSSEGLSVQGAHFDTKSQMLLGKRYAEEMIRLRSSMPAVPQAPTDIKFIDPHVHAMSVTPLGLRAVAKWMEERNVERCIVSPLSHKGSRPQNEEEREAMLANFRPYKGRIDRMVIIDPGEVETVDQAVKILQREMADGAVGFGEHYGVDLMFDDPKNLLLYEACEKVGLPVMFHIDQNKNMVEPGMARVDRVLKLYPRCKVVAHAYWWRQLASGACDRQLQEHPNLYADMSGVVVMNVLNRDRKYAREFLIRNQDKILWATDEGWWSFASKERQMNQHYTLLEELDLPDEVRHKIYRGNSEKVYGLKPQGK